MEHGKIIVDIKEDYPQAAWFDVTITLPGYGNRGQFKLIPVRDIKEKDIKPPFFRPEYAKAIKKGLESV